MSVAVSWALLFLVITSFVALAVNARATYVLLTDDSMTRAQRMGAGMIVWLLPIVGALLMLALYERNPVPRARGRMAADEINPLVEQALQPIAKGETRAAERILQQDVLDTITEHGTHHESHDPS